MVSAYSIGTGKRSSDQKSMNAFVPGPGAYNPIKKQKYQPPAYRIGTGSRSNLLNAFAPGPGTYEPPQKITKEGPRWTFGLKNSLEAHLGPSPGPGAYNPSQSQMMRALPRYSMGIKLQSGAFGNSKAPGPGAYESKSTVMDVPSNKFGNALRQSFNDLQKTPGPGTYINKRPSSAGPRYGFGTSHRDDIGGDARKPGPGTYELKSVFTQSQRKGFSMVSRKLDQSLLLASRQPGPGAYNPEKQQKKQPPSYKIGDQVRDGISKERLRTPGPGTYESHYEFQRPTSASVRIGSALRRPLNDSVGVIPGPGTYEIKSLVGQGRKVIMLGTNYDATQKEQEGIPGPGQYNPSVGQVKQRPQSAKIGTGGRSDMANAQDAPGVGNYNIRRGAEGPAWGFGSMVRQPLASTNDVPGPGIYTLKPMFADVPKYLLNNAPRRY